MPITIGSSWTPPDNYFKGDDGAYVGALVRIGVERDGEFIPWGTREFDGQFGHAIKQDWLWQLEDGSIIEQAVTPPKIKPDGREVITETSTYYGNAVALRGGRAMLEQETFDEKKMIGLSALITIQRDANGYPRVKGVSALPTSMQAAPTTTPEPAPVTEQPAPARRGGAVRAAATQEASGDELPF